MTLKRMLAALMALMLGISLPAIAQDKLVTGKVTDAKDGSALPGATVRAKGTKNFTQTGVDGTFKFKVPAATTTLLISYSGYADMEMAVAANGETNAALQVSSSNLNEVVVVGYGTQRKKDVTASISKVTADKIAGVPAPSFESALAGKAAGVQVTTSSGLAGSSAVIRIRGINSISIPGDPLYVIDGLPIDVTYASGSVRNTLGQDRNPLSNLNPNDIESVEILKDAAAAGIYGSRGSNGVVLITTKRGKGKLRHNFTARAGVSGPTFKPNFVDKNTWLAIRQEAWENDGNTGLQQNLPGRSGGFSLAQAQNNPGTDWWDLATRTGFSQEYNYSVSKGKDKYNFYLGGTYSNEESYVEGNSFRRIGVRGNFDYKLLKNLTLSTNLSFNNGVNNLLNNAWNGGLGLAMSTGLPYYPIYNADGSFFRTDGYRTTWDFGAGNNLVAQRESSNFRNRENRFIAAFSAKYTPIKNLDITASISSERTKSLFNAYRNAYYLNRTPNTRLGNADNNLNTYKNENYSFTANYIWEASKNSRFTFLLGGEYQDQSTIAQNGYVDSAYGPLYNKDNIKNYTIPGRSINVDSILTRTPERTDFARKYRSVFARVNYSLMNRYIFQASLRRDESSVFRDNNQVGYFPTASFAWTLSQESWFKSLNLRAVDNVKFRVGWGLTGTSNIPWNAGFPSYDTSRGPGSVYNGIPTIYQNVLGNKDLKWETSDNLDVALEATLFKNKINLEVGYYRKKSTDVLLEVPVSFYQGFAGENQWINTGSILNEGFEFNINTVNIKSKNFSWNTNFNIAYNYNQVLGIGNVTPDAIAGGTNETRIVPGYPVGTIFTVRYFGVDPADGLPIFLDATGKQTKTLNAPVDGRLGDRVPVGSTLPIYNGGFTNTFRYKNIELNTVFTYQLGGKIWDNSGKRNLGWITDWNIYGAYVGNYWRKPGDVAKYPRPTIAGYPQTFEPGNPWLHNSSVQVFNSDYIRLRELTLSYYLPSEVCKKLKLASAKIYATGFNVLLFTTYPVGDPESGRDGEGATARNASANANFLNPPLQRSFNFGLNIGF